MDRKILILSGKDSGAGNGKKEEGSGEGKDGSGERGNGGGGGGGGKAEGVQDVRNGAGQLGSVPVQEGDFGEIR
jgi:hypothetical protein